MCTESFPEGEKTRGRGTDTKVKEIWEVKGHKQSPHCQEGKSTEFAEATKGGQRQEKGFFFLLLLEKEAERGREEA